MLIKQMKRVFPYFIFLFLFLLLFLNLYANIFQIIPGSWFSSWQNDSESLVINSLKMAREKGFWYNYGLLGSYTQQIGLQGLFFRLIGLLLRTDQVPISLYRAIVTFTFCLVTFYLIFWSIKEFRILPGIILYLSVFFNRWIIVSSRNLYWVTATMLFPFVCMIFVCRKNEKKEIGLKYFFYVAFSSVFIRVACGFEMISTVMISMEIPLFYYAVKGHWERKIFLKRFVTSAIGAIGAFFSALLLNFLQQVFYFGSTQRAISNILYTISKRTGAFNITVDSVYQKSLEASKLEVLDTYIIKGEPLIGKFHMSTIFMFFLAASIGCFIDGRYSHSIEKNRKKLLALTMATWIAFLGPISWYILASPHSYIHTTINYILWSVPFIPLGSILCGSVACYLYSDYHSLLKKWNKFIVPACVIITFYFYMDYYKIGSLYLNRVREDGKQIVETKCADVFYYEQNLYYLIDAGHQKKRIFFHVYPEIISQEYANGAEFINEDFYFKDRELRTPFWSPTKIAQVTLNKDYNIKTIRTGQFDETGREWEISFELGDILEIPREIIPDKLTDTNWTNGVLNDGTTLLFLSDDLSLRLLRGRTLETISGQRVTVTEIKKTGKWLHVILDHPIDVTDGYPNVLKVID